MTSRPVVFLGPTLPVEEAARILPADYRPPVALGDVYAAVAGRPPLIGIVDGYYERTPAVWHKEILFALSRAVPVLGAASMGALRAAELAPYGMVPVGRVAAMFRSGELTDDDEVAVFHAPAESGYRPLSEAMVSIRATLDAAAGAGVVSAATAAALVARAKSLFYPERTWERVLAEPVGGAGPDERPALQAWLPAGRVDLKRQDALALLDQARRLLAAGGRAGPAPRPFEQTSGWQQFVVDRP